MADMAKLEQCVLLVKTLWFLPPPARAKVAAGLYDLGVRVHPELATQNVMVLGPEGMGGHRPRHMVSTNTRDNMGLVRQFAPDLADKMEAATTEAQKQAVLADIRSRHSDVITQAEQRLAVSKPEDFG